MNPSLRALGFLPLAALLGVGCADDAAGAADKGGAGGGGEVALSAKVEPLKSFSFDTGLVPAGSPAQVSLKLSANGGVTVDAVGTPSATGLTGKPGSGKVGVDLHLKIDGRLKAESALGNVDGDLPGLKDIDIAIKGDQTFDPFLVGADETARVEAKIPATTLPDIPLGPTPGKLRLSVVEGSLLKTAFQGSCMSVANGSARYRGELTTSGNLILKGTLVLELAVMSKEIDLGEIAVPIPAAKTALDFGEQAAAGATDGAAGAKCGASKPTDSAKKDGKEKVDPTTGETCTTLTCESFEGQCGDHPDGCGGTFNCGDCAASYCRATTCGELGKTCGAYSNGCGGTLNCGVCADAITCAVGAREPNDTRETASALLPLSDANDNTARVTRLESSDGDEDWFSVRVADTGFGSNPELTVTTTDRKLEVSVFHLCDSLPNYSYCEGSGTQDNQVGKGCRALGEVKLNTDCSGFDETGTAYIRVRKPIADGTCHSYDLEVVVR